MAVDPCRRSRAGVHFAADARRESRVMRGTFAVAPASGGTTTSCAAETGPSSVSTVSAASTGTDRRTTARAIGPSSKWSAAEVTRADDVAARSGRPRRARAGGCRCRRAAGRPGGAAGARGCAPWRRSPGRGSSPCSGARRCGASPVRGAARARPHRPTSAGATRRRAVHRRRRGRRVPRSPAAAPSTIRCSSSRVTIASDQSRPAPGCGSTAA